MKEADGYKQHIITCGRREPVNSDINWSVWDFVVSKLGKQYVEQGRL